MTRGWVVRRAYTLVEVIVALGVSTVVMGGAYGLFHLVFSKNSRSSVTSLTGRSFMQKDARSAVRRLSYRLREAIQILSPEPGASASELVFRDITNADVRLRHLAGESRVVSERKVNGAWVREDEPVLVDTGSGTTPASWPVAVASCAGIRFTPLGPDAVTVHASLAWEGQAGTLLAVIKLRNAELAY